MSASSHFGLLESGPEQWPRADWLFVRLCCRAAITYTDAQIGRVLDALEAEGLAENTVIAAWGDHGFQLGDNDQWAKETNCARPPKPTTARCVGR